MDGFERSHRVHDLCTADAPLRRRRVGFAMTLQEVVAKYPGAQRFAFGDTDRLCADLRALVRSGVRRATCGVLRDFEVGHDALPVVGRHDVARNRAGRPALVIRTVDVTQRRFGDVDTDVALAEGGDETLAGWQAGHRACVAGNGGWEAQMMLVCERFELVEDFGA